MNKNLANTSRIFKVMTIAGPAAAVLYGLIFAFFGMTTVAKGFFIFAGILFVALIIRGMLD